MIDRRESVFNLQGLLLTALNALIEGPSSGVGELADCS